MRHKRKISVCAKIVFGGLFSLLHEHYNGMLYHRTDSEKREKKHTCLVSTTELDSSERDLNKTQRFR